MNVPIRKVVKARYVAPVALAGAVALVGLLSFAPGSADAQTATTAYPSTTPVTTSVSGSAKPTNGLPAPDTAKNYSGPSQPAVDYSPDSFATGDGISALRLPKSFIAPGQALFASNCSTCHGSQALGTARAPNLQGLGAGTVDFWVSTGRMPLADSSAQATRKPVRFNRLQTLELAAFVQSLTPGQGVPIPVVRTDQANLEQGNTLYTLNCAACHTITGAGDALADGAYAPGLHLATVTQIAEAIRTGPGNMPRFGPGNITNAEARDIAAYVHGPIQNPDNPGGFGLGGIGPVGEGFVGLLIGVGALMLVCFWIGDRTSGSEAARE